MSHRWMKFWPQDWEGDVALRVVSLAAQGLWMRLLCAMHRSDPYGHLTMNGRPMSVRQVASLASISEREAGKLLKELENSGVFSRADDGVIFSRRLIRDRAVSEAGRENGKAGGNPTLKVKSEEGIRGGVNPPLKGGPNLLEAEAESEADRDTSLRSVSLTRARRAATDPHFPDFWAAYPRKVGRGAAEKAFASAVAKGATVADIAAGLNRQTWPTDPKFIPHPATWLNQSRWQDDPAAAAPPPAPPERPGKLDWMWDEMRGRNGAPDDFPDFNAKPPERLQ